MSMPKISDINPNINITREEAINVIIASIAMEELSLAHILNAEGEKLQYILGTLEGNKPDEVTICDVMAVNKSIQKTLRDVIKAEMLLQFKLEDAVELTECGGECNKTIKGKKIWRDGENVANTRPASVVISLLRDGAAYRTETVYSTGDGSFTFACVPIYNNAGHEYIYTVDETIVPRGYTKKVEGFNIINTAEPGVRSIDGTKTWDDDNNDGNTRPTDIKIYLFRNGVQVQEKTIPNNVYTFSFTNEPRFDDEGSPFVYTLKEDAIVDYVTSINGFNITNTLE